MYVAITNHIQVTAIPDFMPDRSDPEQGRFFWSYTIEIANLGTQRVQLLSRHWLIIDANGRREEFADQALSASNPCSNPERSFVMLQAAPCVRPQA